jgi:mono/diheme cytochrome c family protein
MHLHESKPKPRNSYLATIWSTLLLLPALSLCAGLTGRADEKAPVDAAAYGTRIKPLLKQYCVSCHGNGNANAGVNFDAYGDLAAVQRDQAIWRKVATRVRERTMPPAGLPQPTDAQREQLTAWITQTQNNAAESAAINNPGRVLIHRLNRVEYNNTIRDLLGVDTHPADKFPADGGGGGGFDNNADTLFIPPILMERYFSAAAEVLDAARPGRLFAVGPGKQRTGAEAARQTIARFATRAYRRPVEPAEVDRLLQLYRVATRRGVGYESAVKYALKAVLVSPNFLFRVEEDRNSDSPYPVRDYELASRLSYFLWSSMPDDTLFHLAAQGRLHLPAVLNAQVKRMLLDPKSYALADSFAGQWLRVRDLYTNAQPDPNRFKDFTPTLRDALVREPIDFFYSIVHDGSSLLDLLDADYTYANAELAKHYGISGVTGDQLRRVPLPDRRRGGVLTMGSVLTLTSYPQRTSPVLRGKWVLSEILGSPPPPPPPVVATLPADDSPRDGLTFRQQLEKHRKKPECAGCHSRMDPIGFGLENFDATGRWRDEIGGKAVDSSGVLVTGEKFSGPVELKRCLMTRKDEFIRNLTEKMLAYALGRGLEPYDMPSVSKITAEVAKDGYRSTTLITAIVDSYPFRYRKNL